MLISCDINERVMSFKLKVMLEKFVVGVVVGDNKLYVIRGVLWLKLFNGFIMIECIVLVLFIF